jgi:DNA-binding transcriptional ArsR family regulator
MVEQLINLDTVFQSLADPTRRDILRRVGEAELSIGEIAQNYNLTFGAISKHLKVLERASLIVKKRKGREQVVKLAPQSFIGATEYLEWYKPFWTDKLISLETYLKEKD